MQAVLNTIERVGNRLPHPATLFAGATIALLFVSDIADRLGWAVVKPALGGAGSETLMVTARSLLVSDGLWWLLDHLVINFIQFPPLAVVVVGMLGIGVAERSGFIAATLSRATRRLHAAWLTPAIVFLGIMSSLGLDAGYVVLPPIAAALYAAQGRSPLAGVAASFAGISAGFSANLSVTALDPLLAGFSEAGARFLLPDYDVAETANWWFMIASTFALTLCGWAVTAIWVEPRLAPVAARDDTAPDVDDDTNTRALTYAWISVAVCLALTALAIAHPSGPLHGAGDRHPRWVEATVPLIFLVFFVPGMVFGFASRKFRTDRDVAEAMGATMAALGPYIVLAFFAAQFIEGFKYSGLGEMLAITGGQALTALELSHSVLILGFIGVVMFGNLVVGSASAKYAFFAPVFVPMFMQVGISPELTQAAYRVGDSITNVITPLNPYMIIILALVQRHVAGAGLGTVVALMLPYSIAFAVVWPLLLLGWMATGIALGPGGSLTLP